MNIATPVGRIEAKITIGAIIMHGLLWILIGIITAGIGFFFYPYSFAKFVINQCSIIDGSGRRGQLVCDLNIVEQLAHILVWFLLTIITFGIAGFFYLYRVFQAVLNNTKIVY